MNYFNEWSCRLWDRWDISRKGAREYALKAIELEKNDYVALMILGRIYLFSGEYEKAEYCLRKSIRLNPNDSSNLVQVAFWMCYLGLAKESEQLYLKTQRLNPLNQDQYMDYGMFIYFLTGKFEKSLELGQKSPTDSSWVDFYVFIGANYYHLGEREKGLEYWKMFLKEFEKKIYNGNGILESEALKWERMINPFKVTNYLDSFLDFVEVNQKTELVRIIEKDIVPETATFIRNGDTWNLYYQGDRVMIRNMKGFFDIACLLKDPEKEFHCTELMGAVLTRDGSIETMDNHAKNEYKRRLNELKQQIEDAEEIGLSNKLEILYAEYDQLIDYLSDSLGLGGKPRTLGSSIEKARTAVTWRIRNAIKKIEPLHPALAKHLQHSIKTGTFCSYFPEIAINWEITV